jgi:metallophosphoesterase superfamily enzyme
MNKPIIRSDGKKFKSIGEAAKYHRGEQTRSNIRRAIKNNVKYDGYDWKWETDYPENTLVIGDLHEPFTLDGYLEFCYKTSRTYSCTRIVFAGDVVDNHYTSYHEADPDGHSAGEELDKAVNRIQAWYQAFPDATVILGNHDLLPNRKAFSGGISSRWVKSVGEVLKTPNWRYKEELEADGILYVHGTGQKARNRMKVNMMSVVQGHYHSESYIDNSVGINHQIFCMQVGCGIDRKKYAFAYGKNFAKPHINCGVIVEGTPILKYMPL